MSLGMDRVGGDRRASLSLAAGPRGLERQLRPWGLRSFAFAPGQRWDLGFTRWLHQIMYVFPSAGLAVQTRQGTLSVKGKIFGVR